MSMKYKVGQTVHKVTQPNHSNGETKHVDVVITKIGRKWAFYKEGSWDGKFCIKNTLDHQEGAVYAGEYFSPEKVYLSRQDYEDRLVKKTVMKDLCSRLCHTPQEGVTLQNIKDAAKLLKIELEY